MTREDARYYLQSSGFSEEQIDTIEQAFKQEPCEDVISRQAALGCCRNEWEEEVEIRLKSLPPVKPQEPKTGHWIIHKDCEGKTRECICDQCGYKTGKYTWHNPNFCSNCGADMRGEQDG